MSERLRILLLTANPANRPRLDLENEHRLLRNMMRDNEEMGNCELLVEWAARQTDLLVALQRYKPHVVHFAGHGNEGCICLEDDEGISRPLSKEQLSVLFSLSVERLRLIVLNACLSAPQTERLGQMVDYIVGTTASIADNAAVSFTAHFYQALAVGNTVREAFHQAKGKLAESGEKARAEQYQLLVRAGADESKPLLPPFANEITTATFGELTVEKDLNIANVINKGPGRFAAQSETPRNTRREIKFSAERANVKGSMDTANEINEYE
jgi:CHAT domain